MIFDCSKILVRFALNRFGILDWQVTCLSLSWMHVHHPLFPKVYKLGYSGCGWRVNLLLAHTRNSRSRGRVFLFSDSIERLLLWWFRERERELWRKARENAVRITIATIGSFVNPALRIQSLLCPLRTIISGSPAYSLQLQVQGDLINQRLISHSHLLLVRFIFEFLMSKMVFVSSNQKEKKKMEF